MPLKKVSKKKRTSLSEIVDKALYQAGKQLMKVAKITKRHLVQRANRKLSDYHQSKKNGNTKDNLTGNNKVQKSKSLDNDNDENVNNDDEDDDDNDNSTSSTASSSSSSKKQNANTMISFGDDQIEKNLAEELLKIKNFSHLNLTEVVTLELRKSLILEKYIDDDDNNNKDDDTIEICSCTKEIINNKRMIEAMRQWVEKCKEIINEYNNQHNRMKNNDSNLKTAKRMPMNLSSSERSTNLFLGSLSESADASAEIIKQRRNEGRERKKQQQQQQQQQGDYKRKSNESDSSNFTNKRGKYNKDEVVKPINGNPPDKVKPNKNAAVLGSNHPSWQAKKQVEKNKSLLLGQVLNNQSNIQKNKITFDDDD